MNKVKFVAVTAAVCALSFGIAGVAGAQSLDASAAPKLKVVYNESSLASDSGVRQLYARLSTAAEKVCGDLQVGRLANPAVYACRKQAVAEAVAQIHNTRLADLSARYAKMG